MKKSVGLAWDKDIWVEQRREGDEGGIEKDGHKGGRLPDGRVWNCLEAPQNISADGASSLEPPQNLFVNALSGMPEGILSQEDIIGK